MFSRMPCHFCLFRMRCLVWGLVMHHRWHRKPLRAPRTALGSADTSVVVDDVALLLVLLLLLATAASAVVLFELLFHIVLHVALAADRGITTNHRAATRLFHTGLVRRRDCRDLLGEAGVEKINEVLVLVDELLVLVEKGVEAVKRELRG